MVTTSVLRIAETALSITIEVTVTADSASAGIELVEVVDRARTQIISVPVNCERFVLFDVPDIARFSLPVFVVVRECMAEGSNQPGAVNLFGPLLNEERQDPSATVRCLPTVVNMPNINNAACIGNQLALREKRNEILRLCGEASDIRSRRDANAAAATVLFTLFAALVAAAISALSAPIFGGIISAILFGLAAGVLYFAIVAAGLAIQENERLERKQEDIRRAQREFSDLASQSRRVCCPEFITESLDLPECS